MGLCDGLSHCKVALAFAVLMDVLGGAALLVGVFAHLEIKGQDFGDLLVYTGTLKVEVEGSETVRWDTDAEKMSLIILSKNIKH